MQLHISSFIHKSKMPRNIPGCRLPFQFTFRRKTIDISRYNIILGICNKNFLCFRIDSNSVRNQYFLIRTVGNYFVGYDLLRPGIQYAIRHRILSRMMTVCDKSATT